MRFAKISLASAAALAIMLGSLGPDYYGMVCETFGVGPLSSWQSLCN